MTSFSRRSSQLGNVSYLCELIPMVALSCFLLPVKRKGNISFLDLSDMLLFCFIYIQTFICLYIKYIYIYIQYIYLYIISIIYNVYI